MSLHITFQDGGAHLPPYAREAYRTAFVVGDWNMADCLSASALRQEMERPDAATARRRRRNGAQIVRLMKEKQR